MRYFKLTDGRLEEYSGPLMGAAWYAAEGWLPYAGTLGPDWLYVDAAGALAELSAEEYAALRPEPPKRYSKLRIIEEFGSRWPEIEALMTEMERTKFMAADYLESGREDVETFLARLRLEATDISEILARCEI